MKNTRRYRPFTAAEDALILDPEVNLTALAADLDRSIGALSNRRYALRHNLLDRPRQAWGQEDDRRIMAEDRPDDLTLANEMDRSVAAIQVRRCLLKKRGA